MGIRLIVIFHFLMISDSNVFCCTNYKKRNTFLITNQPHTAALILARGGSKGIKLKNIQKVGNQTLLERSLNEIFKVQDISSVWVSTDSFVIAEYAEKYKVANIHWRSPESATDNASSLFAIQEFLEKHPVVDRIVLVQCTSPFLKKVYLQRALELFEKSECVFSASRSSKLRWKQEKGGKIKALNFDFERRPRRQEFLNSEFLENGMFYLARKDLIWKGKLQSEK